MSRADDMYDTANLDQWHAYAKELEAKVNELRGEIAFNGPEPVIHNWPDCGCNETPPNLCSNAYSYIGEADMLRDLLRQAEARVATIEAETREACAVVAWSHYTETCQRTATPPSTPYRWSAAAAIRAMQPASNTRDAGPTPFAGRTTDRSRE